MAIGACRRASVHPHVHGDNCDRLPLRDLRSPVHPHVHGDNLPRERQHSSPSRFTPMCMGTTGDASG